VVEHLKRFLGDVFISKRIWGDLILQRLLFLLGLSGVLFDQTEIMQKNQMKRNAYQN